MTDEQGIEQVAVLPNTYRKVHPDKFLALTKMIGADHVFEVDRDYIMEKIGAGLWRAVFNKMWLFNLTEFDKLIILDGDVLIRMNIAHWFDYGMPCASQQGDNIEWNSGAMVIEPNNAVFNWMVDGLSQSQLYQPSKTNRSKGDTFNSGYHDQGYFSSIFTAPDTPPSLRMKTMPAQSSLLSSRVVRNEYEYWGYFRRHIYETVDFTVHKPYRGNTRATNLILCDFLLEWKGSMEGIEQFNQSLSENYLLACPPPVSLPRAEGIWEGFLFEYEPKQRL